MSSYRFLLSRRWLLLTLVAIVLIPTMIKLGFWQLHRHERRVANNELIAASLAADPVPVEKLTAPGAEVPKERAWRTVIAKGRYDTEHEVVVRQRKAADGAQIGYHVVTPLVLDDGYAVLVNRGWIKPDADITAFPEVPPAPKGEVKVTGRLRPDETTGTSGIKDREGLPDRQIMLINSKSERVAEYVPHRLLGGYIELTSTSPKPQGPQPEPVPDPDHESIGAHFAYAVQWWLFAAMVPVGWVVLARRDRRELAAGGKPPGTQAPPSSARSTAAPAGTRAPGETAQADASTDAGATDTASAEEVGRRK